MHRFSFPTQIHFGSGSVELVAADLKANGVSRPLIVTDSGIASLSFCNDLLLSLNKAGLKPSIFSNIVGNPVKSQVVAGVNSFRESKSDGIVGLGGGAALDVAKAIALMANHPGDLFDYEDGKQDARPIDQKIPYWVAVPTTAGTGSEVGRSAVISDDDSHVKKIIFDPKLLANAVFADPELTINLPAHVTAATGMDALTHCIEAYLAKGFHPICDGIALEGLRLGAANLRVAFKNPADLQARGSMMMSSMMGAIAFQKGLGVTHSCAHALGTVVGMHHGLANAIMIDYALKFNLNSAAERFKNMSIVLGLEDKSGPGFIKWLTQLKQDLEIPKNLTSAKVAKNHLEKLVSVALADSCHQNNPCPVSRNDFSDIFKAAF